MRGSLDLETRSRDDTAAAAASLASLLVPGDVVSLTGDLGAGKTSFVQGAAAALGVHAPVSSPTFVLVREYRGDVPIYHLDVYRLERLQEVHDLGFEDFLDPTGVMFIEWGDAIEAILPESHLRVELRTVDEDDDRREIRMSGRGPSWALRWERLESEMKTWRPG